MMVRGPWSGPVHGFRFLGGWPQIAEEHSHGPLVPTSSFHETSRSSGLSRCPGPWSGPPPARDGPQLSRVPQPAERLQSCQ